MKLCSTSLVLIVETIQAQIEAKHQLLSTCVFLSNDWIETNGELIWLEIQLARLQAKVA